MKNFAYDGMFFHDRDGSHWNHCPVLAWSGFNQVTYTITGAVSETEAYAGGEGKIRNDGSHYYDQGSEFQGGGLNNQVSYTGGLGLDIGGTVYFDIADHPPFDKQLGDRAGLDLH